MATSNTSASLGSCSEGDDGQIIFLMLLDDTDDGKRVLMIKNGDRWYLPFFKYVYRSHLHKVYASRQLARILGLDSDYQWFVAGFDPLGHHWTDSLNGVEIRAYSHLVHLERSTSFLLNLPAFASWKDLDYITKAADISNEACGPNFSVHKELFETVGKYLSGKYNRSFLADVRYKPGWFKAASEYFTSLLERTGVSVTQPVMQYSMSSASSLLNVETVYGSFFLKSPALGCNEVIISKVVFELFPLHTVPVVGVSESLNCFVTEPLRIPEDVQANVICTDHIMDKIINVHRDSVAYVPALRQGGIPDRSPRAMIKQIEKWITFGSSSEEVSMFLSKILEPNANLIIANLECISSSDVPLTLVHGDFSVGNSAYYKHFSMQECTDKERLVLYDWQYGCISHPFFEFHRLREEGALTPEMVETYLSKWADIASIGTLQSDFDVSCTLGWMLKFWGSVECIEACLAEKCPVLLEFAHDCLELVASGLGSTIDAVDDVDNS